MKTEEHQIISRAEAKAQGLKHYFTGVPCKHGGVGRRLVGNGTCLCAVCRDRNAESQLRWRENNPERVTELWRRYHQENRERLTEINRQYREKNSEKIARYREENRDKEAERRRRYIEKNREKIAENDRRYREENREVVLERNRLYYEKNPEKARALVAKRRAAKRQAVPVWFSEFDQFAFEEAYDLAAQRQAATGIEWHVDHLIPLQAKKASGLHCAANIQVIPGAMNRSKHNKMLLTKPLEWLN